MHLKPWEFPLSTVSNSSVMCFSFLCHTADGVASVINKTLGTKRSGTESKKV